MRIEWYRRYVDYINVEAVSALLLCWVYDWVGNKLLDQLGNYSKYERILEERTNVYPICALLISRPAPDLNTFHSILF